MSNSNVSYQIIFDQKIRSTVVAHESIFNVDKLMFHSHMFLKASSCCEKLLAELEKLEVK